jgi:hypothetical protein
MPSGQYCWPSNSFEIVRRWTVETRRHSTTQGASEARREFSHQMPVSALISSSAGFDFQQRADAGRLVDCEIIRNHPEWFGNDSIPRTSEKSFTTTRDVGSGQSFPLSGSLQLRLLAATSSNRDPSAGRISNPRFLTQVALADPPARSAAKAFEMIIQQQMQREINRRMNSRTKTPAARQE